MTKLPPIYFYIRQYDWLVKNMPESSDVYLPFLSKHGIDDGEYAWTLQTYLRLRDDGFPCQLTGKMPEDGIVLDHYKSLAFNFQPGAKLLIVYLKADKPLRPYTQLRIVQNTYESKNLRDSYYMPHWPQPGLIPRNPMRGDKFEIAAFFGTGGNLASELLSSSWREQVKALGMQWCFKGRTQWNDFSDVDVVVAVRRFGSRKQSWWTKEQGAWKPPTKLYNSWNAGVPAIIGYEPAFRDERRSELDYLEVNSLDETISALEYLRNNKAFRQAMIENGRICAEENAPAKLVKRWRDYLTDVAVPAYESWCNASNTSRQIFWQRKYIGIKVNALQDRMKSILSRLKIN